MKRAILSVLLAVTSCKEATTTAVGEAIATPAASSTTAAPSPLAPSLPPSAEHEASCPPAVDVKPAALFTGWPTLVGHRVRFAGRVERVVDFTDAVIVAPGGRFVVTASPDRLWSGVEAHSFTVLGSASVGVHGRTVLPSLVLDDSRCGA